MTPITPLGSRYGIQGALGRSVKRASAGTSWWLAGGISADDATCVFQAKGAASQEDTYKNLVTGTTLLNSNVCTSWTSANGWYYDGSDGLYNLSQTDDEIGVAGLANSSVSWIISIAPTVTTSIISPFRFRYSSGNVLFRIAANTGYTTVWNHTSKTDSSEAVSGIYACGGLTYYINGTSKGTLSSATYGANGAYGIGCEEDGTHKFLGYIHAFALYKTGLSQAQVQAVGTAMAAL